MAIGIKYVGLKDSHTDSKYGTKLMWKPGQVHNVEDAVAARMLAHTDTYAEAKPVKNEPVAVVEEQPTAATNKQPVPLPHLEGMDKQALMTFAQQHYGENLHPRMTEANMRNSILSFIQSRGR